jgi:competence protein ComEC
VRPKKNHKGAIPFVLLLIPYLTGIAAGMFFFTRPSVSLLYIALAIPAVLFVVFNLWYNKVFYKISWLGGILILIILGITGLINISQHKQLNNSDHFSRVAAKNLLVKITDEPVWKNETLRFTATVTEAINGHNRQKTSGQILITIKSEAARSLFYGDVLLIPVNYYEVDPPFNPAEFNYKKYLANKNVYHQAYLYPGQYVLLSKNAGNPVIAFALRLRQQLVNKLKTHIHDADAAAVASTLILGYKAELSSDVLQAYSKTGTIHILSVSGGHVGLLYLVLLFALGFLNRYKHGRLISAVIIITLVWFYALLTGFSPPVCRAAVMLSLIITGKTYNRYINSLNILSFSAFAILLFDPLLITDVGFQLSYLAVAGMILLQPVIYKRIEVKNKWLDKLWLACSVSVAAQVITFPLSAYYFHQLPVYFLISNLFIIIPSGLTLCGGMLYLFLPEAFFLSGWLGCALEKLIVFTNKVLGHIEHAPFASVNKIWLTTSEYLILYGIIIIAFIYIKKRRRLYLASGIGLLTIFCFSINIKRVEASEKREIVFLNLRKNMGIIFKYGDQATVLTDVAIDSKTYPYSIQPYLDSSKVSHVKVIGISNNIQTGHLNKSGNQIRFGRHNIFIIDKATILNTIPNNKTGFIYITGNPKIDTALLRPLLNSKTLVIAGSNSKRNSDKLVRLAKQWHINYKILYRNKALVVASN